MIGRRWMAGAAAGVAATLVMSVEMAITKKSGHLGEFPPKKLTRRILTALGHRPNALELHALTGAAHLAYGAGAGVLYALVPRRNPAVGAAFGIGLWALSYMGWIPKLGLMRPPSLDKRGRPTAMVLAHVVFGSALDLALAQIYRLVGGTDGLARPRVAGPSRTAPSTSNLEP